MERWRNGEMKAIRHEDMKGMTRGREGEMTNGSYEEMKCRDKVMKL